MDEEEEKIYIPPDYDGSDDDNEGDDVIEEEDEGAIETYYDKKLREEVEEHIMTSPVFPNATQPSQQNTPRWGHSTGGSTTFPSWQSPQQPSGGMWGNSGSSGTSWRPGGSTSPWGQNSQKETINRSKKVIFIDFLDGIVETFNSNGSPGYLPRDIYDLTPRFDIWQRLSAFSPERVYIMIPKNLLPSTNGAQGWEAALTYYCCSLSSFLRVPYTNCQILVGSVIGQSKESLMLSVINDKNRPIFKEDIVCLGIYSGYNGQPDIDKRAAEICGVDYIDLYNLLNNMI